MKYALLSFLIFNSISSYSQDYSLEAKVESRTVVFRKAYPDIGGKVDSVQIINDSFSFKGKIPHASEAKLSFDAFESYVVRFALFPGRTHIKLLPSAMNYKIQGPPSFVIYKEYEKEMRRFEMKMGLTLMNYYKNMDTTISEESIEDDPRSDSMEKVIVGLQLEHDSLYNSWAQRSFQTELFPLVIQEWKRRNPESEMLLESATRFSKLNPADTSLSRLVRELEGEIVMASKEAPLFTLPDTLSRNVSLKAYRGKYVLVDFWASWCGPCRKENPNVVSAFKKFGKRNFTVLGVALEEEGAKDAWLKAIRKDGLLWTQVTDFKGWESPVAKLYNIESIPQNFLVSPEGKIIAVNLRGPRLHRLLDKVLPK